MDISNQNYKQDDDDDGDQYCDFIFVNESFTNQLKYLLILFGCFCLISIFICYLTAKLLLKFQKY
ncbi:hypothetical protein DERP_004234 [Dermatophagoides pteronyssinus]|uniref:Uncharacterized protein n=1 Tax=Dermatophagoides pteronyssinus TaxID=6956 RepID=A0ABQ8J8J4_DERPT|nr:hypothetical protein DERP_004234 [Dermatophagoides pteronyssinus]